MSQILTNCPSKSAKSLKTNTIKKGTDNNLWWVKNITCSKHKYIPSYGDIIKGI